MRKFKLWRNSVTITSSENCFIRSTTSQNMRKVKPYECEKAYIQMLNLISHQQIPIGKKSYSCKKCGKAPSHKPNITDHEKIHLEQKPLNVINVEKTLVRSNTSPTSIMLLTLERNPTNVRNMENPLIRKTISLPIRKFILVRNHLDVLTVRKLLFRSQASLNTRKCILEKNPIHVKNVGKPSAANRISQSMRKFILEKNLLNVRNAEQPLARSNTSLNTTKFI